MHLTPMSARRFAALFAVGLAGSLIAMWLLGGDYLDGDGRIYAFMAEGGWDVAVQPFANRVFTPGVVALLPGSDRWGFMVVAAVGVGVTVAMLDRFLSERFSDRVVALGLAIVVTGGALGQVLEVPSYIDAVTLAAACTVFVGLGEKRWLLVVGGMLVGVANHEMALMLLVVVGLTAWRERRWGDGGVVVVLSVGMWWLLHRSGLLIEANHAPNLFDAAWRREVLDTNLEVFGTVWGGMWWHARAAFGVALILAPLGWRRADRLTRDAMWMLPVAGVACLGATNWGRMFVPLTPAVIALACGGVAVGGLQKPSGAGVGLDAGSRQSG